MLTSTKVAICALLLAASASGALAQGQIGHGASVRLAQRVKPSYVVPHPKSVRPSQFGNQLGPNDVPFAPF